MRYPKRKGLPCPECDHLFSKIIDSRPTYENLTVRRRRSCIKCGYRWTTWESSDSNIKDAIKEEIMEEVLDTIKNAFKSIDWGEI